MALFQRGTPNGGVKCMGYEKNRDFRPISRFFVWKLEENKQNCHAKIKNTDHNAKMSLTR